MRIARCLRAPISVLRRGLFALPVAIALVVASMRAEVPTGPPTFSDPLSFENVYWPFHVGVEKTFVARQGSLDAVTLERFTSATRAFFWKGSQVETRCLEEHDFEDGELVEISKNYFAEADDGTVYYFGEVVDIYEGGVIVSHEGSWLVGGPTLPSDPPTTATALDPTVFMPANPEVGDTWKPEDLFPIVDETVVVEKVGKTVVVPAGQFTDCIRVEESTALGPGTTKKWYAPNLGFLQSKEPGEFVQLVLVTP